MLLLFYKSATHATSPFILNSRSGSTENLLFFVPELSWNLFAKEKVKILKDHIFHAEKDHSVGKSSGTWSEVQSGIIVLLFFLFMSTACESSQCESREKAMASVVLRRKTNESFYVYSNKLPPPTEEQSCARHCTSSWNMCSPFDPNTITGEYKKCIWKTISSTDDMSYSRFSIGFG